MSDDSTSKIDPAAYSIVLPKKVYKLRVKEVKRQKTKEHGHPMDVLSLEIMGAPKVNGVDINGLDMKHWVTLTEKSLPFANATRQAFGLDKLENQEDIENANPNDWLGTEAFAVCFSEKTEQKDDDGQPLLDPYTQKPLVNYRRQIDEFISRPEGS